jgi:hypothetical protein
MRLELGQYPEAYVKVNGLLILDFHNLRVVAA